MEQKILSLKDDKINSEVELYEYPEELRGGRNLVLNSLNRIRLHSNDNSIYPIQDQAVSGENYRKFRRTYPEGITSTEISTFTTEFFAPEKSGYYTYSTYFRPNDFDIELRLRFGKTYGKYTLCKAGEWTQVSVTAYIEAGVSTRLVGVWGSMPQESVQWIDYNRVSVVSGNKATPWSPAPEDLGLSYPDFITEFKPSISDRYILTEELFEYPVELIGGRNLLLNSNSIVTSGADNPSGSTYTNTLNDKGYREVVITSTGVGPSSHRYVFIESLLSDGFFKSNQDYVLSFEYKTNTEGARIALDTRRPSSYGNFYPENTNGEWRKGYVVLNWVITTQTRSLLLVAPKHEEGAYVGYRKLKIEYGNKATPWTPAPEDLGLSYPDHIQSFGTSFSNNILINEFIEQ